MGTNFPFTINQRIGLIWLDSHDRSTLRKTTAHEGGEIIDKENRSAVLELEP